MKLTDLKPNWVNRALLDENNMAVEDDNGDYVWDRTGVGMSFDCPCGCKTRGYIDFENPLDGGNRIEATGPRWKRTGDTFETLTLTPSIHRKPFPGHESCGWHGWITNGKVTSV